MTEIGQLDLELRLKVEDQIDQLSSEPYPKESLKDFSGEYWHLRIPDTSFELRYAVDENRRQIQLIALQPLSDQATPDPAPGNHDHA